MPVNKKYPLAELAAAGQYYQEKKGRMITLEYILIAGVNDSLDQVKPLAALAPAFFAKVNLIPYNPVEGLPWARPGGGRAGPVPCRAGTGESPRHLAARKGPRD